MNPGVSYLVVSPIPSISSIPSIPSIHSIPKLPIHPSTHAISFQDFSRMILHRHFYIHSPTPSRSPHKKISNFRLYLHTAQKGGGAACLVSCLAAWPCVSVPHLAMDKHVSNGGVRIGVLCFEKKKIFPAGKAPLLHVRCISLCILGGEGSLSNTCRIHFPSFSFPPPN